MEQRRLPGDQATTKEGERLDLPFELKAMRQVGMPDGAEAGLFEGLASTFGERDLLDDVIEPGAFGGLLAEPRRIRMLWQHDAAQPIGTWEEIRETERGLFVRGRLILEVRRAFEAWALLKAQVGESGENDRIGAKT